MSGIKYVLVDCPFCGSSNIDLPYADRVNFWVTCLDCGCDGPLVDKKSPKDEAEARAIVFWNRRKLLQLGEPIPEK